MGDVYYRPRNGNILGGWIVTGDNFYSKSTLDPDEESSVSSDEIADVIAAAPVPPSGFYRITITGIPTRDSPETGNPFYNPNSSPPISRSYLKSTGEIEDALYESEGLTAEDFATLLTEPESQGWVRIDAFEVPDIGGE